LHCMLFIACQNMAHEVLVGYLLDSSNLLCQVHLVLVIPQAVLRP
jgi:hypothetical protein